MKFIDVIWSILRERPSEMTPQEVRDQIKAEYPDRYVTEAHRRNVDKGHYNNLDHALLAEIYIATRLAPDIYSDKSTRPMTLTLEPAPPSDNPIEAEALDSSENEDLNRLKRFETCRRRFAQADTDV